MSRELLEKIPPHVRDRWPFGAAAVAVLLLFWWWHEPVVRMKPGMLVGSIPKQTAVAEIPTAPAPWQKNGLTVTPLARYELQARVLSRKRYRTGHEARLSPIDLALGWTTMSDQAWIDAIDVSQHGRWFNFKVKEPWVDPELVLSTAANTHMIPATDKVESTLLDVRRGDVLDMAGWLIEATDPSGGRWTSSLSREDRGGHACEVFWVEHIAIITKRYPKE